jgi:hypothetical protein
MCVAKYSAASSSRKIAPGSFLGPGHQTDTAGGDLFIPGTIVQDSNGFLDLRIADYQEAPALHIAAARGSDSRLQDFSDRFVRYRVWFQSSHRPRSPDDLEQVGVVNFVGHGILAGARLAQPRLSDRVASCKARLRRTIRGFAVAEDAHRGMLTPRSSGRRANIGTTAESWRLISASSDERTQ